jgi:hypothetical protein
MCSEILSPNRKAQLKGKGNQLIDSQPNWSVLPSSGMAGPRCSNDNVVHVPVSLGTAFLQVDATVRQVRPDGPRAPNLCHANVVSL